MGITFEDTTVQHTTAAMGGNGVSVDSGSQVVFTGMCYFQNLTNAVYIKVGTPSVDVKGVIYLTNCTNRYGADPGQNIQSYIANHQNDIIVSQRVNPTDYAYISRMPNGGFYTFETATGRKVWGVGTDYVGDVALQRRAAGVLAVDTKNLFATGYGNTATRPAATTDMIGAIRFNTDSKQLEVSDGGLWYGAGDAPTSASTHFRHVPRTTWREGDAVPRLVGGGGGGGGGNIGALSLSTACHGGPGGGAGMVIESAIAVTPGDTITILIGAGGTGGQGATVSAGTAGNNGAAATAGGTTMVTDGTGKVLIAARGGGAGPAGPGASVSAPVTPAGGGAYGSTGLSYAVPAPGCGSFGNFNAMPTYNGVAGGASASFSQPTNGGGSGWTTGCSLGWPRPQMRVRHRPSTGSPEPAQSSPAAAAMAAAPGGRSGTGGAGGAGAPGAVEFWWVS